MAYSTHFGMRTTPQTRKALGKNQVKNNAGGDVFQVSDWDRLSRFLILGSEGGTYYVGERKLTIDNANCILRCLKEDGKRVVDEIVAISDAGRAPKNEPALFALAIAAASEDAEVRSYALASLPKVARIGTHLFQFAQYVSAMRGWGTGLRKAIARWYNEMDASRLAYQVVKYPQRVTEEGVTQSRWSHRDLMRKAHPFGDTKHNRVYDYVTKGKLPGRIAADLKILRAAEQMKAAGSAQEVADLIEKYRADKINLPHELIPKEFASKGEVWEVMLPGMPLTALIRSLGRLTSYGVLGTGKSANRAIVLDKLTDESYLRKSRVHPLSVLVALKTYSQGGGFRGKLTWQADQRIVDALDEAFYASFGNVEATGKNYFIGIDASGSMGVACSGIENVSCAEAAAVLSMVTARVENNYEITVFDTGIKDAGITPRMRLDQVLKKMSGLTYGGTDCSLPMTHAMSLQDDFDSFMVLTDSETYYGSIHPFEALKRYRAKRVEDAKLAVVAMNSNGFSIADPSDPGMLDVVGFDTATPNVISSFMSGSLTD